MLESKKKENKNNEKIVHLFVLHATIKVFQLSYHSMECTDMNGKSEVGPQHSRFVNG